MAKRIKLEETVAPKVNFTHRCALCYAWLFCSDNFCPNCGRPVQDGDIIIMKKNKSDDDYNKPMEEPV